MFTQTKPTKKPKPKKYYIVQKKVICLGEPTERAIFLGVMKKMNNIIFLKYIFMVGLCKKKQKNKNKKKPVSSEKLKYYRKKAKKQLFS